MRKETRISTTWIFISYIAYMGLELFIGRFVMDLVRGSYVSSSMHLRLELGMMLLAFFLGGLLIGFLSPNVRVMEPSIGAFLAVLSTFLITFFTPYRFFSFAWDRLLIGGGIAFVLAWVGSYTGESWAARLGNRRSRDFIKD